MLPYHFTKDNLIKTFFNTRDGTLFLFTTFNKINVIINSKEIVTYRFKSAEYIHGDVYYTKEPEGNTINLMWLIDELLKYEIKSIREGNFCFKYNKSWCEEINVEILEREVQSWKKNSK